MLNIGGDKAMGMDYGSRQSRFVAFLIDVLILGVASSVINFILTMLLGISIIYLLSFPLQLLFSIGYLVFYQHSVGQTLGKKVMHIKIIDQVNQTPSLTTFFMREIIGKMISGLILGIGYLMILWDSKRQGLHDKIAHTYVVKVQ